MGVSVDQLIKSIVLQIPMKVHCLTLIQQSSVLRNIYSTERVSHWIATLILGPDLLQKISQGTTPPS